MPKTELNDRLRNLHAELSDINNELGSTQHVDDETMNALGQLVADVGGLVDRTKEVIMTEEADISELQELNDRVLRFETEHPRLTRFVSQMTDLLAMMGI